MSSMSDYLENKLRRQIFRGEAYSFPATLYVSLHTAATADDGTGTEVSGGSYARVAVTANTSEWTVGTSSDGQVYNTNAINFPVATADWGTVGWAAIWDAASAGNMLFHGPLAQAVAILTGQSYTFAPGQLLTTFA